MRIPDRDIDHVNQGLSLIISQHRQRPRVRAWASAYLKQCQLLEDAIYDVLIKRLIDWAQGDQLDMLGSIVGELRANFDDADYKTFIYARIRINRSLGTTTDVLNVLSMITGTPAVFREYRNACLYIAMTVIPDRDPQLLYSRLHDTKAAGVKLTMIVPTSNTAQFKPKNVGASDVLASACGDANHLTQTFGLLSDALSVRDPKAPAPIVPGPPVVAYVDPPSAEVDDPITITIHGSRFRGVGYTGPGLIHLGPVNDNTTNVTNIVIVSDTEITCTIPLRDPSWPATVEVDSVDWTGDNPPAGGTTLDVHGHLFTGATAVTLGVASDFSSEMPVTFTFVNDALITFTAPGGNLYTPYSLRVYKGTDYAELDFAFEYTPPPTATITSIVPSHGPWNDATATLYGSGFVTVGIDILEYNAISAWYGTITVIDDSTVTLAFDSTQGDSYDPYSMNFTIYMTANGGLHGDGGSVPWSFDTLTITGADPESISIAGGQTVTISGLVLGTLTAVKLVDDTNGTSYDCSSSITLIDDNHASFVTHALPGCSAAHIEIVGQDPGNGIVEGSSDPYYDPYRAQYRLAINVY